MDFETCIRLLAALALLYLLVRIALALRRGEWRSSGRRWRRGKEPRAFWAELGIEALAGAILALLLLLPRGAGPWLLSFGTFLLALARHGLDRALRRRSGADDWSGDFVPLVLLYAVIVAAAVGLMALFLRDL